MKMKKKFSVCFDISTQTKMEYNRVLSLVSKYRTEKCLEKLEILREYRKDHTLINSAGFFTNSLKYDYIPPKTVRERIKIGLRTERQIQKTHQECELLEQEKAKKAQDEKILESKRATLSDSERSELTEKATKMLLEMGIMPAFINSFLIERQINTILLSG